MERGANIVAGLWLLLLAGLWGRAFGGMLLAQYPGPADPPIHFSHLAIDHQTKKIFAAGTNRLIQLDADLNLEYSIMTGPKNDSPSCHALGCDAADIPLTLTDNYNKILLIEPESRTLIFCGSIFQGACYKYKLNNISAEPEFIPRAIAANDAKLQLVGSF